MSAELLNVTAAAAITGRSRRTIARLADAGDLAGAIRDSSGRWQIPTEALRSAGLLPEVTPPEVESAPPAPTPDPAAELRAEAESWRTEAESWRRRAEVAEALAAERERVMGDIRQALDLAQQNQTRIAAQTLRMSGTDGPPQSVTATTATDEPPSIVMSTAPAASLPRRRWWHRRLPEH